MGHHVEATDGEIGRIEDLLVDDQTWAIRYLIVETGHWWAGRRVLVAPQWITGVSWSSAAVSVGLTQQQIKDAPPYDPDAQLDRLREQALSDYYGRSGYWTSHAAPRPAAAPVHRAAGAGRKRR